MDSLSENIDETIKSLHFDADTLFLELNNGRIVSMPLVNSPRLLNANDRERSNWQLIAADTAVHWPDIDEDLDLEGICLGAKAPPGSEHFRSKMLNAIKDERDRGAA